MKEKITAFIQDHWKYLIGLALVLALLAFGYYEYREWKAHLMSKQDTGPMISVNTNDEPSKPGETQVVYLQGQNATTRVQYVQKEVDPATGQQEKRMCNLIKKVARSM